MSNHDTSQISQLLGGTVDALDLPPELHAAAERQYQAVGQFLAEQTDAGGDGWDVSPQGSFLLGTVTPAIVPGDQFDLDMVCRRNIDKTATTQSKLKGEVGALLNYYVRANKEQPGAPSGCHERRRCWTLHYPVAFHMDVLPAIPNPDGSPTGIMLTDKTLRFWQFSDPAAYANWFKARIDEEIQRQRGLVAAALAKSIEEVPERAVKATLQRVVQVLKRHRDLYFAKDLDNRPPSILITTLAARAYQGDDDLFSAVLQTTTDMPAFIERGDGIWLVMNPVADENFADKWAEHPERPRLFKEWLDKLSVDLEDAQGLKAVFPDSVVTWRAGELSWIGQIQPTPASGTYTVKIVYRLGGRAHVTVLEPRLEAPDGFDLPHVFPGDRLCLHHVHEWDGSQLLADTIVPWASEWLLYYELWKATGEWLGGGHEPAKKGEPLPNETASQKPRR